MPDRNSYSEVEFENLGIGDLCDGERVVSWADIAIGGLRTDSSNAAGPGGK